MIIDIAAQLDGVVATFGENVELQDLLGISELGMGLCPTPYLVPGAIQSSSDDITGALLALALSCIEMVYLPELEAQHETEEISELKKLIMIANRQALLSMLVNHPRAASSLGFGILELRQYALICREGFMQMVGEKASQILQIRQRSVSDEAKLSHLLGNWLKE